MIKYTECNCCHKKIKLYEYCYYLNGNIYCEKCYNNVEYNNLRHFEIYKDLELKESEDEI